MPPSPTSTDRESEVPVSGPPVPAAARRHRRPRNLLFPRFWSQDLVYSLGLIGLVIGVEMARVIPSIAIYLVLAAMALRSPLWTLRAFTAGIFATTLTTGITQEFVSLEARTGSYFESSDIGVMIGRYILLAVCALKLASAYAPKARRGPPWIAFLVFVATTAMNAIAISYEPMVSALKLITLAAGIYVVFRLGVILGRETMEKWFLTFFGAIFVLGLPLVFSPQGYIVNGRGFQGLFNHPQPTGVIAGVLSAHLFVKLLAPGQKIWGPLALLGVTFATLLLSGSRTGLLAFGFSTLIFGSIVYFGSGRKFAQKAVVALVLMASATLAITSPAVQTFFNDFIVKGGDSGGMGDLYEMSRGGLIAESWDGFVRHPIFGVGFGLPNDPANMILERDPFFDIPVTASVEKGLIFTAILEELGLFGSIPALAFFLGLLWVALFRTTPQNGTLVFAAILTNMGESTLTSFGGVGAFIWLAIGVGISQRRGP